VLLAVWGLSRVDPFSRAAAPGVFRDLGNLLFMFLMLWGYMTFSQLIIIWSGNLPEETPWYMNRLRGGWQWLGAAEIVLHFALPFVVLLSRDLKRNGRRLAAVALLVVAMRFVDLFWLITPAFSPRVFSIHWLDPLTLIGVGGVWLATFVGQLRARPLLPLRDPEIPLEVSA
jgi:hypothetical protein